MFTRLTEGRPARIKEADKLIDALTNIKERERDIIILHLYHGVTLAEIAKVMEMTEEEMEELYEEALDSLKECC